MNKILFGAILGILVISVSLSVLGVIAEDYTQITNETCDGTTNCSESLECYDFPDIGLRCAELDPCSYYICPENETCSVAESDPEQVICSPTNATDGNETEEPTCDSDNLGLCLNETDCADAGGFWYDDLCNEEEEENGCSELSEEACNAKKNCLYNADEGTCNKIRKQQRLKERLQEYLGSDECPEGCVCAGSTIKCDTEEGRVMTVVAGRSGNIIIQTKGVNASTTVELIKNETGFFGEFRGKIKEIKYTPDQVKERVLKKLKMTNCEECEIELKDDGSYEMNISRQYRILGIIPKKITEVSEVDSETGEIIQMRRPWWRFLAVKSKE